MQTFNIYASYNNHKPTYEDFTHSHEISRYNSITCLCVAVIGRKETLICFCNLEGSIHHVFDKVKVKSLWLLKSKFCHLSFDLHVW